MSEKEYKCDYCKGIFKKKDDWTERDAKEEHLKNFGFEADADIEPPAILCDDCYKKFMGWFNNLSPSEKANLEKQRRSWN